MPIRLFLHIFSSAHALHLRIDVVCVEKKDNVSDNSIKPNDKMRLQQRC